MLCLGASGDSGICAGCRNDLPLIENPCAGCAAPLSSGSLCSRCLNTPPPFRRVSIPYRYAHPLSTLVHALKFRRRLEAAAVLGALLADFLELSGRDAPQCIVPVPLHPRRQRQRGFNQSLEIARPLAQRLGIALEPRLARRTRPTAAQSSLRDAAARRSNVRGAFSVDAKLAATARRVAIVDDVVTTGATAIALAQAMRAAGIGQIDLWCVARAGEA